MNSTILFPWQKTQQGRVFISYRREDTQWVAGRLTDSLSQYFGDDRVFRDIENIEGGADFSEVIQGTLGSADGAIVLIGNDWLTCCDEQGQRRLDDPKDWVAREVEALLEAGIPVYPVLVEDTPMVRADELPENIRSLARYNAISISDKQWGSDVGRLARLVSLDIPSANERKLEGLNLLLSLGLLFSVFLTLAIVVWKTLGLIQQGFGCDFMSWPSGATCSDPQKEIPAKLLKNWPLSLKQSGISFLAIVPASAMLFVFARLVVESHRSYFLGAAWVGTVGSLMSFILLAPISDPYEPIAMFFGSTLTALSMFVFMNLSGFRPE